MSSHQDQQSQPLSKAALKQLLRIEPGFRPLCVALWGPHAFGYATQQSPIEIKGLHIEPTESLVGLTDPPRAFNWIGELDGKRVDYASYELGQGLKRLLRGDGSVLERILAPQQLLLGEDIQILQRLTRRVICRRFFHYYRNFSKGVLRDYDESEQRTVRHLLGSYRQALTGIHLLYTGKVSLDLQVLADRYGFPQVEALIAKYLRSEEAVLEEDDPAINHLVKLHSLLEKAAEESPLIPDPENPAEVEEYLLDMRRRFFDAPTVQEPPARGNG